MLDDILSYSSVLFQQIVLEFKTSQLKNTDKSTINKKELSLTCQTISSRHPKINKDKIELIIFCNDNNSLQPIEIT